MDHFKKERFRSMKIRDSRCNKSTDNRMVMQGKCRVSTSVPQRPCTLTGQSVCEMKSTDIFTRASVKVKKGTHMNGVH